MRRSARPLLALSAALFAALVITFPSVVPSAPRADPAPANHLAGAKDPGGAVRVASTSAVAAITPFVRAERVWSKASNRGSRLLHPVSDVSSAPSAGAIALAGVLLFGLAPRFGRRLAVVASDPRAPPLRLQLR
jgi:hypothetical protein